MEGGSCSGSDRLIQGCIHKSTLQCWVWDIVMSSDLELAVGGRTALPMPPKFSCCMSFIGISVYPLQCEECRASLMKSLLIVIFL